jgi:uncharacterized membrane protein YgcG
VTWAILGVALVAFVLALIPTRRLFLSGWRPAPLAAYLLILVALAVVAVLFRAGTRVVVPALLVLYVLPFVGAPEVVARTVGRIGRGRPPRIVDGRSMPVDGPVPGGGPDARTTDGPGRGDGHGGDAQDADGQGGDAREGAGGVARDGRDAGEA